MKELTLLDIARETINKVNRCKHDGKYNHDVMVHVNDMIWLIEQLSERVTDLETVRDNMLEDAEGGIND